MANTSPYIVILCGGTGPRLWPLSRANHPKQFLNIFSPTKSLLQETVSRALKIVPKERLFIVSNVKYQNEITKHLGKINLISEPEKKNTALAILHSAAIIKNLDPKAVIVTMPSDHFVGSIPKFKSDILKAATLASHSNSIVTIGIKASSPNPSYGYIVHQQSRVTQFIEKPDAASAQKLIDKNALWNSGIYTFAVSTLETELSKLNQNYYRLYQKLLSPKPEAVKQVYRLSENLPIDKVISEKSKNMLVINATFPWSDVGDWKSIYQLKKQSNGFAVLNPKTQYLEINSKNCLLSSTQKNKLIGLVGVDNLAIIDTPDALLICNIAHQDSYTVRDLVSKIVGNSKTKKYFLKS